MPYEHVDFPPILFYWTGEHAMVPTWGTGSKTSNQNLYVGLKTEAEGKKYVKVSNQFLRMLWFFSLFSFNCSVLRNSCSNILALLLAPAQPKGCFANAGSAKLPSGQPFCPWVLAASAELLPQVPTVFPSSPKPRLCSDHTHTDGTCSYLHQLEAPSKAQVILPFSLCHHHIWVYEGPKTNPSPLKPLADQENKTIPEVQNSFTS